MSCPPAQVAEVSKCQGTSLPSSMPLNKPFYPQGVLPYEQVLLWAGRLSVSHLHLLSALWAPLTVKVRSSHCENPLLVQHFHAAQSSHRSFVSVGYCRTAKVITKGDQRCGRVPYLSNFACLQPGKEVTEGYLGWDIC